MRQKIKIPGILFLIIPILLWIGYINYDSIVCITNKIEFTWEMIIIALICLIPCTLIEICIRGLLDKLGDSPTELYMMQPFIWIGNLIKYINKNLTVEL